MSSALRTLTKKINRCQVIRESCSVDMRQGVSIFHGLKLEPSAEKKIVPCRGKIKGFSRKSRNRLRIQIFSLKIAPLHFQTLTYPKEWPVDSTEWKRHLDNMEKAIKRQFPGSWFYWKLEPQKRGAPHFHLLGTINLNGWSISSYRTWLSETWFRIVGSNDILHLRAGTQCKKIKGTTRQLNYYVTKYLGKEVELIDWESPGRFWGKSGDVPSSPSLVVDLDKSEFILMRRLLRRWVRSQGSRCRKYSDRLAYLASFHVIVPWRVCMAIIQYSINGRCSNETL